VFAGIDISGGVLGPDKDSNTDVYGPNEKPQEIAFGHVKAPAEAQPLLKELSRQAVATSGK
jgi:lipid-binding SYLF domain-containing protein